MKTVLILALLILGAALAITPTRSMILRAVGFEDAANKPLVGKLETIQDELKRTADDAGVYPHPEYFEDWLIQEFRVAVRDPWGEKLYYTINPSEVTVGSKGPDKQMGTQDDIVTVRQRDRRRV